jgi:hypothetical protein
MSEDRSRGLEHAVWLLGAVALGLALLTLLLLQQVRRLDGTIAQFGTETAAQLRATDAFIRYSTDGTWLPAEERFGPAVGGSEAPVQIVEFVDFECPACQFFAPRLRSLVDSSDGLINLTIKHLPLSDIHANAYIAALGAHCAHEAGRFWDYSDRLYQEQSRLAVAGYDFLMETALKLELPPDEFRGCLQSTATRGAVDADLDLARRLGIRQTPTFFINGKRLDGPDWELLEAVVEWELRRSTSIAQR